MLKAFAALLTVGVALLLLQGTENKHVSASHERVRPDEIGRIEAKLEAIMNQHDTSEAQRLERLTEIGSQVAELNSRFDTEVVKKDDVAKMVLTAMKVPEPAPELPGDEAAKPDTGEAPKPKAEIDDDGCNCGCAEKHREIEAQLTSLKERVASLEASKAALTSSYGAGASVKSSGGGSTGSVKSGGSTGSVASSGGSTGSVKAGKVNQPATPLRNVAASIVAPVRNRNHWTHPGTIDGHLNSDHAGQLLALGISTDGMTREQMLDLHDSLHEGTLVTSTGAPVPLPIPMPAVPPRMQTPLKPTSQPGCPGAYQDINGDWVCPNNKAGYSPSLRGNGSLLQRLRSRMG